MNRIMNQSSKQLFNRVRQSLTTFLPLVVFVAGGIAASAQHTTPPPTTTPPGHFSAQSIVAKQAALKAERTIIEDTLTQVHWNRRRAAEQLGVSYKTLLNKIKECGISRA